MREDVIECYKESLIELFVKKNPLIDFIQLNFHEKDAQEIKIRLMSHGDLSWNE